MILRAAPKAVPAGRGHSPARNMRPAGAFLSALSMQVIVPMPEPLSVSDCPVAGHDRVCAVMQGILRAAALKGWTDEALETLSGVKARTIKSYRVDGKEPSVTNALSLCMVLGKGSVNALLSTIGYRGAVPLEEADAPNPGLVVAGLLQGISAIAEAASDGRFDHTEMAAVTAAADLIIETAGPLSSAGRQ